MAELGRGLYELMTQRGGSDSEYADLIYGTVVSASPLKFQISNTMVIDGNFITLGKNIGTYTLKGKATNKGKVTKGSAKGDIEMTSDIEITVDNSLHTGDKVSLIRGDGGQRFYLFERER